MRAAEILAAIPDLPPDIRMAIQDLDARAYGSNNIPTINALQLHSRLSKAIEEYGSMSAAAEAWGIKRQTLHAVMTGDSPTCPPAILRHLGLKRIPAGRTLYREV